MAWLKNRLKNGKNCMHWNVAPDALPGFATGFTAARDSIG